MDAKVTIARDLNPAERRLVIGAIAAVVQRNMGFPVPTSVPPYPDGVPEIEAHVDHLVRMVRESGNGIIAREIVTQSCLACPHQFPARYCPVRRHGGCALYRCAEGIGQAIVETLELLDGKEPAPLI